MPNNEAPFHIAIMRDLFVRTGGQPRQWAALQGILERLAQNNPLAFQQAVHLARTKGLIIAEGTPPHRACLTEAGCAEVAKLP